MLLFQSSVPASLRNLHMGLFNSKTINQHCQIIIEESSVVRLPKYKLELLLLCAIHAGSFACSSWFVLLCSTHHKKPDAMLHKSENHKKEGSSRLFLGMALRNTRFQTQLEVSLSLMGCYVTHRGSSLSLFNSLTFFLFSSLCLSLYVSSVFLSLSSLSLVPSIY